MKRFVAITLVSLMLSASMFSNAFMAEVDDPNSGDGLEGGVVGSSSENELNDVAGDAQEGSPDAALPEVETVKQTTAKDIWEYESDDFDVTITKYNGSDANVVIPMEFDGKGVRIIGNGAFADNTTLVSVTLPDSVAFIGVQAFKGCTSLTNVVFPEMLRVIDEEAFAGCVSLVNLNLTTVEEINAKAFAGCSGLVSVTIPNSAGYIGDDAFDGCADSLSITGDIGSYVHRYAHDNDTSFKDAVIGEVKNYTFPANDAPIMRSGVAKSGNVNKTIILDAGHGINTAGKRTPSIPSSGNFVTNASGVYTIREWSMNDYVCKWIVHFLRDRDCRILRSDDMTGASDTSLTARQDYIISYTRNASISIHHNANTGNWNTATGVEVFYNATYDTSPASTTETRAVAMAAELSRLVGLTNRGAKTTALAMTNTKLGANAYLTEGAFYDSPTDYPTLSSQAGYRSYARAIANVCINNGWV